jgi:hypothetical protein
MARGKYVKVTYRTGAGTASEEVEATRAGGDVHISMPDRNGLFVTVEELNKAGDPVRSARFLATEVLSIVEGQRPPQKLKR